MLLEDKSLTRVYRPTASSQNVPPGHPSFRRQRASRACESKCLPVPARLLLRQARAARSACERVGPCVCLGTEVGRGCGCERLLTSQLQRVMREK